MACCNAAAEEVRYLKSNQGAEGSYAFENRVVFLNQTCLHIHKVESGKKEWT